MIVGSLFSGAGLLDCGLHQAGIGHAWFVEREPDRRALLERRWPGRPVHDDVRNVGAHNLERVDGIVGGFPCKGASNAGPRTGFAHPETALWAEFERVVRELRPRYVAVENVAAIRSLHHGAVWGTVLGDLAALGYDVAWGCVRAADVGAPHGRDRIFAVARHADGMAGQAPVADGGRRGALARSGAVERALGPDGVDGIGEVAADARGGRQPEQPAEHGGQPARPDADAERCGVRVEWGSYEPAIRRWEAIHGPAPAPLTRVRGMDDGDAKLQRVRARLDRQRLSALGDGVHVYVGRLLGDALMELARADQEVRDAA
jgi:DNA (cytosine-5)-methyltransferase 1